MKTVFLAIGNEGVENYLKNSLSNEFVFKGQSVYREGVLLNMESNVPEILILSETLAGKMDILELVTTVRELYNKVRIIFIAHHRVVGDEVLAELVNKGVYDIIEGTNVSSKDIIALMRKPNEFKDVSKYQARSKVDTSQKSTPKVVKEVAEAPVERQIEVHEIERIIEKEVPVEIVKEVIKEVIREVEVIKEIEVPVELPAHLKNQETQQQQGSGLLGKIFGGKNKSKKNDNFANKVVVFTGGKGGVGNSTLALNTALRIAEMNRKVLYIEINPTTPTVSFWFDIQLKHGRGIDHVLEDLKEGNMATARSAITRGRLAGNKIELSEDINNPKFITGNIIDFMFFSAEAMEKKKPLSEMATENFKEMFLNLFYQENYHFVIIDIPFLYNNYKGISDAFIYCHKIFTVISQDVSSVAYTVKDIESLEKRDVKYKNKNTFIMNRCEPSRKLNMNEMKKWLGSEDLLTIPNYKDFSDILLEGLPILQNEKDPSFRKAIDEIVSKL